MNKNGQGIAIDIIILVLAATLLIVYIGNQIGTKPIEIEKVKSESRYVREMLRTTMNKRDDVNLEKKDNSTFLEIISCWLCKNKIPNAEDEVLNKPKLNKTLSSLNRNGYYYLFKTEDLTLSNQNCSRIKTQEVSVSRMKLDLPCGERKIYLGIWPKELEVKCIE